MALLEGILRTFQVIRSGKGPVDLRITHQESLAADQVAPLKFEMSRAGRRFILGNSAAITGIAPVQALPTTAAQWSIQNRDPARSLVFEEIGMYLTSGTPGVGGVLLGCIYKDPVSTGSADTGTSVSSASDGGQRSQALVKSSVTITTPAAPNWYVLASNPSPNVTAFASSTYLEHRNLQGSLIVPPGRALGLAVVAPAGTTPLFAPFAMWSELESPLE